MTAPHHPPERMAEMRAADVKTGVISHYDSHTVWAHRRDLLREVDRLEAELAAAERISKARAEQRDELLVALHREQSRTNPLQMEQDAACRAFGVRCLEEYRRRGSGRWPPTYPELIADIESGKWPPKSEGT